MDHCAYNPAIASRISAVYTGLGLLAQNNLFLRKFRFRTVKPHGALQGALGPGFFSESIGNDLEFENMSSHDSLDPLIAELCLAKGVSPIP